MFYLLKYGKGVIITELIRLTEKIIEKEHICCAISNEKDIQVKSKKEWLKDRIKEGLVFLKGDVRGKCFIEYIPAEYSWVPIKADGYMFINCFWVSGKFKGQGNANLLLNECIRDSKEKGKLGLCVISSSEKKSFLSDSSYLRYKGFLSADFAEPYFELMYLPFSKDAAVPEFIQNVKFPKTDGKGFELFYTSQCPFNAKYVTLLENYALASEIPFKTVHITSLEDAQKAPAAVTSFALFYNGKFITNEILSVPKFAKLADSLIGDCK